MLFVFPRSQKQDDPLGRPVGAPLWPEWEDYAALMRKRELIGERAWSALFQQTPLPSGGRLVFDRSHHGGSTGA